MIVKILLGIAIIAMIGFAVVFPIAVASRTISDKNRKIADIVWIISVFVLIFCLLIGSYLSDHEVINSFNNGY